MRAVLLLAALVCVLLRAADWPLERGDPHQSGWQRHETVLTPQSVKGLQVLWKYKIPEAGALTLATPTILGRVITHRGIKELVFTESNTGTVIALDGDLGTVFWERPLTPAPVEHQICSDLPIPAPVISPAPSPPAGVRAYDENADPTQGNRPLYALAPNGEVHSMSPITGLDLSPPFDFLPSGLPVRSLNFFHQTLYALTSATCASAPDTVWAVPVQRPNSVRSRPGHTSALGSDPHAPRIKTVDSRITGASVVANGVIYTLDTQGNHTALDAFDFATGQELYSSGDIVVAGAHSGLAVANGHVCFGASFETLYCFGLPFEQ